MGILGSQFLVSHEGSQWKSSVKRSETEIAAKRLTRIFRGACPNKIYCFFLSATYFVNITPYLDWATFGFITFLIVSKYFIVASLISERAI